MDNKNMYFGYDEETILEVFRNSEDQVDANKKISSDATLLQLAESSGRMVKENKQFLYEIYNELDRE